MLLTLWRVGFKMADWLQFTKRMSETGETLKFFGYSILSFLTIISVGFFWFIVFTFYQPYQEIAFLMIKFLRVGVGLFVIGYLLHYLFYFINELIHRRRMRKVEVKIKGKK